MYTENKLLVGYLWRWKQSSPHRNPRFVRSILITFGEFYKVSVIETADKYYLYYNEGYYLTQLSKRMLTLDRNKAVLGP